MMHGFGYGFGDWMMSGWSHGMTGWMVIPVMGLGFLLIVALIAWFVWSQRYSLGLTGVTQPGQTQGTFGAQARAAAATETAEQIARRRLAAGEIDAEEYRRILATLREQ